MQLVPDALLAVLGGLIPGSEQDYLACDIVPVLGSLAEVDAWTNAARPRGERCRRSCTSIPAWRGSASMQRELKVLQQDHARLDGIALRYVMTHLVASEVPDDPLNEAPDPALRRGLRGSAAGTAQLRQLLRHLPRRRVGPPTWRGPARRLYGINPVPAQPNPMRLPVRLRARVLAVREVQAGRRRRLQRHVAGDAAEPHRHGRDRLCRRSAPQPVGPRLAPSLTAPRCRW